MIEEAKLIALAKQTGLRLYGPMEREVSSDGQTIMLCQSKTLTMHGASILRFARLVVAIEREACALECTKLAETEYQFDAEGQQAAQECAERIRKRSNDTQT